MNRQKDFRRFVIESRIACSLQFLPLQVSLVRLRAMQARWTKSGAACRSTRWDYSYPPSYFLLSILIDRAPGS